MTDERVHVVIVGSGPAGSTYARVLADQAPDARILLVEAGPVATDPPAEHVANIADREQRLAAQVTFQGPFRHPYPHHTHEEAVGHPEVELESVQRRPGLYSIAADDPGSSFPAAQAASGVGGMGSHWFGACPRPYGSERIDAIDAETLDAAYDTAERLLRVSNDQFTDRAMAERVRSAVGAVVDPGREPARRVQQMPMALVRASGGVHRSSPTVILGDLLDGARPGFQLRPETLVQRILVDGDRATGVELRDLKTGEVSTVEASHVVVAANSVHGPQLLFASGIRPPALGRHLNEHPMVSLLASMHTPPDHSAADEVGDTGVMSDPSAMTIAASGVTWIPFDEDRFPFHSQIGHVDPRSLGLPAGEEKDLGTVIGMSLFLRQELDPANRIVFSETEKDWRGMPAFTFDYRLSDADLALIERAKAQLVTIADSVGEPLLGESPTVLPPGSSLHYEGTLRLGAVDDGTSVCDPTGRVWGTANLFVAGNGVIPTSTACNPTLTGVALAVIGAGAIARELALSEAVPTR